MAVLYLCNKSADVSSCLDVLLDNDALLLMGDGLNALFTDTITASKLYALKDDVAARGVPDQLLTNIELVDYDVMVDLCERSHPIVTWS